METTLAHSLPTDERTLVRRAQAGDVEAFGALVSQYMRRAYYAALGLVGSHDDALDLSQEAFSSREPFSLQSWARLFCSCRSRGRNGSLIGRTLIKIFKDDRMRAHAKTLGANAVIGTRFNSSYVMGSASEILAYGTAVIVEPESSP